MSDQTLPLQYDCTFCADWESCDAKVTYQPKWKSLGSTPKTLKLSSGRAYRVSVRPETTVADFAAILAAVPWTNIRTVRIVHGGPISAPELGKALAELRDVTKVGMSWTYRSTGWQTGITQADGKKLHFDLENWPVDEVTAALGHVVRANVLNINMDEFKDSFSLRPLFQVQGLKSVKVKHSSYAKLKLDWTGLSQQIRLQSLNVEHGFLSEVFWSELGKLRQLQEFELHWPEKAKARRGSLAHLSSLKKLNGVCLFDHVPEAFQTLAECPALQSVKIDQCKINDATAAAIGSMPHVQDCYIWNTTLTDAGMKSLCRWPEVKSLVLCEDSDNPKRITQAGFKSLANLASLEMLHLQGFENVAASAWSVLQKLTRLKRLQLMSRPAFDLMEAVGSLPTLERLCLSYCNGVGSAGLQQLRTMPRLKALNIHVNHYHPYYSPIAEVSELRQLTSLFLGSLHKLTDEQLGHLTNLTALTELYLYESPRISDRGIASLAALRKLRLVSLHRMPKLTDQTLNTLVAFPRLETLFLRCNNRITDKGLARLSVARNLKHLQLDFARNLTGDRLLELARQLPLEEILVSDSPHLTIEHMLKLAAHPNLKRVGIMQCRNISNDDRKTLAEARPDWKWPSLRNWQKL
jgi:Leucine-rich repeat (LRR) protein